MNKLLIGCDVGERYIFTFSTNNYFTFPNKKIKYFEELKNIFVVWFDIIFAEKDRYIFVFEEYLKEHLIEVKDWYSSERKRKIKLINKLIQFFLSKYSQSVVFVNSVDSSIECYKCGFIAHENRTDLMNRRCAKNFKCLRCGCSLNSDLNASIVLVNRYVKERNLVE